MVEEAKKEDQWQAARISGWIAMEPPRFHRNRTETAVLHRNKINLPSISSSPRRYQTAHFAEHYRTAFDFNLTHIR